MSEENINTTEELKEIASTLKPNIIKEYFEKLLPELLDFGVRILVALILYFVGIRLIRLVLKLLHRFMEKRNLDAGVIQFFHSFVRAVLYFFLAMLIISWFGIAATSVVALLGSAGLTVGLALQGSLSNFAGGVLILLIKPFKVGDYIIEDNKKNEGVVTEIQLFYTKLLTSDNRVIIIPNGILSNSSLTNVTGQEKRRVDIHVLIAYSEDAKRVKQLLLSVLDEEKRVIEEEGVAVYVESLEEAYIKINCSLWVKTEDHWRVKSELTEKIINCLNQNQVEVPKSKLEVVVKNASNR